MVERVKVMKNYLKGGLALSLFLVSTPIGAGTSTTCLREAVYAEARGETALGKQAVANTILNRVSQTGFPKTICGVVNQPGQFKRARAPSSFEFKTFPDVTRGATHFQRQDRPNWLGLKKKIRIGNHTFYGR